MKKTVLITGARGTIGSLLRTSLAETYNLRLLSAHPIPEAAETIVADIADLDSLVAASRGVDSIIHLAAVAFHQAPWEQILHSNIIGAYNVYEAACQAGVPQVIFASTNHTVGSYDLENPAMYTTGQPILDHLVPVRPDGYYGVSKSFGEVLGRYYADQRGLRVICLRIGAINQRDYPRSSRLEPLERIAALWLSHKDMLQLTEKSLEADHVKFEIVYGISNNKHRFYDLDHARKVLGYIPQDNAEERLSLVRQEIAEGKRAEDPYI